MELVTAPTREVRTWTTDSRRWSQVQLRHDDVIIATAAKCGTTWMQQIVSLLVFQSGTPRQLQDTSPWIDMRIPPLQAMLTTIEAQSHRRFLKSHLPFDALPIYDTVRYIHVARDGRDAFMSWHNHAFYYQPAAAAMQSAAGMSDETIGRPLPRPMESPHDFFEVWMTEGPEARFADEFPASRYFELERSWWRERARPNLLLVHYNDLKSDLAGEMHRIAAFLDIEIAPPLWPELVEAAGFQFMREHGATLMPRAAMAWDKGHERFLNEGTNGRWREALTPADAARYAARVKRELSPGLARWLEDGRQVAGDPRSSPD